MAVATLADIVQVEHQPAVRVRVCVGGEQGERGGGAGEAGAGGACGAGVYVIDTRCTF